MASFADLSGWVSLVTRGNSGLERTMALCFIECGCQSRHRLDPLPAKCPSLPTFETTKYSIQLGSRQMPNSGVRSLGR